MKPHFPYWLQKDNSVTVLLIVAILGMGFSNARLYGEIQRGNDLRRVRCVQFDQPNAQAVLNVMRTLRFDVAPQITNTESRARLTAALDRYFVTTHNTINFPCDDFPTARTAEMP